MSETKKNFKIRTHEAFQILEKACEDIDPDLVECHFSLGSLTLLLSDQSKIILSTQPSVEQIWMVIAKTAKAFHFQFDSVSEKWRDNQKELFSFLKNYLQDEYHICLPLSERKISWKK